MGGCNNDPTARQFSAAYKKVLTRNDTEEVTRGNCLALESIPIPTAFSNYLKDLNVNAPLSKLINSSLDISRAFEQDNIYQYKESVVLSEEGNTNLVSSSVVSPCAEKIVAFIAGFVSET
ncbi:hypothetical protein Hamer_G003057 [Homarus americanus]|uniref:Transposable element P transposase-like RNase H C-terminal domain-containing protein n=1 Tax=Homarus americanus TaxID=6706 RepID=A0A8J5TEY9_HOMAM|nr:hypothetical protein Hamer_G003057 [Homarus americanus]